MNPMSEQEFQDYVRQANWFMRGQMDENRKAFKLDSFQRFDWDPWRGELVFSAGGVPKVVAKIQITGSLSTRTNGWTWAWANSGLLESVRKAVLLTKQLGEDRSLIRLIQPRWGAKESDAWEMTAVTAKLNDAKGAFRCPGADGFTYMIFTDIRAVSDHKRLFGAQTCVHVLDEDAPILLVSRELDGEVLALCGGENDTAEAMRDVPLARLLDMDTSLERLADMPDGWAALRESPDHDWARSKSE